MLRIVNRSNEWSGENTSQHAAGARLPGACRPTPHRTARWVRKIINYSQPTKPETPEISMAFLLIPKRNPEPTGFFSNHNCEEIQSAEPPQKTGILVDYR